MQFLALYAGLSCRLYGLNQIGSNKSECVYLIEV